MDSLQTQTNTDTDKHRDTHIGGDAEGKAAAVGAPAEKKVAHACIRWRQQLRLCFQPRQRGHPCFASSVIFTLATHHRPGRLACDLKAKTCACEKCGDFARNARSLSRFSPQPRSVTHTHTHTHTRNPRPPFRDTREAACMHKQGNKTREARGWCTAHD